MEHLPLFLELKKNNPGQWKMGLDFDTQVDNKEFYLTRICSNDFSYSVGWIEDDRLLSMSTLWESKVDSHWIWLYYCNVKQQFYNLKNVHGHTVISEMFQESFRRQLSTCTFIVRGDSPTIASDAKGSMTKKIQQWHDLVPEIKKFHWVDELTIPAGETSKYEYIRWQMNYKVFPLDLRVRRGFIKQEYRKEILFSK